MKKSLPLQGERRVTAVRNVPGPASTRSCQYQVQPVPGMIQFQAEPDSTLEFSFLFSALGPPGSRYIVSIFFPVDNSGQITDSLVIYM
ncbi:hypothetical protein FKM82_028473 [Ascaphus truei]